MANKWDYPTAAVPTVTITFDIAGHLMGDSPAVEFNQAIERSKGGTTMVESFGSAKRLYPFSAYVYNVHATSADYADVIAFIITSLNGAENTFQWTDENSIVRTVRLVDGTVSFEMAGNYKKFTVNLEEQ